MNHKATISLFCSLLLVASLGCDGDGSSDDDTGIPSQVATFEASISGSVEMDLGGTAFSGTVGSTWGLALTVTSKNGYAAITFLRHASARPEPGTYVVGGVLPEGNDFYVSAFLEDASYVGNPAGTLEITSSTATNVRGTFDFSATSGTVGNPQNIDVEGGFNATNHAALE
jgi:hypothetical protein